MEKQAIIQTINDFFESPEEAEIWWGEENEAFEEIPRKLLTSEDGCDRLRNMIYEIETGTFK